MDDTVRDIVLDLLDLHRDIADGSWPSAARLLDKIDPAVLLTDGNHGLIADGDPVGTSWRLAYRAVSAALGGRVLTRADWECARDALAEHLWPWMPSRQPR